MPPIASLLRLFPKNAFLSNRYNRLCTLYDLYHTQSGINGIHTNCLKCEPQRNCVRSVSYCLSQTKTHGSSHNVRTFSRSLSSTSNFGNYSTQEHVDEPPKQSGSKKKPVRKQRQEAVELFQTMLEEKTDSWTNEDWEHLGDQLSSRGTKSWEVVCMHTLMLASNLDVGKSLMRFLKTRTDNPGHIISTFYIGLLGKTMDGDEAQEAELKEHYDYLVSTTDVFDAASIEVLAEGLSHTKYYKECANLIEICKLTSVPGASLIRNTLFGALRHNDTDFCTLALKYFDDYMEPSQIYQMASKMLDITLASKNEENLQMLMDFMEKHSISLTKECLEDVLAYFKRSDPDQWEGAFGNAHHKSGKCTVCGHQLPKHHIEDEDFSAVQAAFLDQVIVSDNIFFKTSPQEVESFVKFVDKFGPFDVVIDGLNALHAAKPGRPDRLALERLVSFYCDEGKRVLILGSLMLKSNVKRINGFKPKPAIYMTKSTRADDAFFLYAALHSGKDTLIVSADKLRDHKFRLQPHLRPVFNKWLASIQVYNFINSWTGIVNPKRNRFNLGPIKDENGWHIPVNDVDHNRAFGKQGLLCLRHGAHNFPSPKPDRLRQRQHSSRPSHSPRNDRNRTNKEWFDL